MARKNQILPLNPPLLLLPTSPVTCSKTPAWATSLTLAIPESPERLAAIKAKMAETGLDKKVIKLSPLADVVPHIRKIHTDAHVKSIQGIRTIGPIAELAVGGALAAVKAVCEGTARNAFCAMRPPGHHALNTGQEEGFCFYNNVAIAARYAQEVCKKPKILIVDWDFHHGNGTEAAFYADPTVLYFSTHYALAYPGTGFSGREGEGAGRGFNINVHMPAGSGDEDFVKVFTACSFRERTDSSPTLFSFPRDSTAAQTTSSAVLTYRTKGLRLLTRIVMDIAHTHSNDRIVSVLEGGYTPEDLAGAVCAHVKTLLEYEPE